jgi:DNA-binding transcriptional regulator/RsmH inhibitor MraZ
MMNSFERELDDKNRLTLPAEIRHEFEGGKIILTKGFDNTLALYSQEFWQAVVEPTLEGEFGDETSFALNRRLQSGQSVVRLDPKRGRVTLERRFMRHAGIGKYVSAFRVKTKGGRSYWGLEAAEPPAEA